MGTALEKLENAKQFRKLAAELAKGGDTINAGALREVASRKVKQAIKQLKPRRRKRSGAGVFKGR